MWKTEQIDCERCGHAQVSVHPDCERIECSACGHMMQSQPTARNFDPPDVWPRCNMIDFFFLMALFFAVFFIGVFFRGM